MMAAAPSAPSSRADRKVRHPLPAVRWPTREEAARARWFSPLALGPTVVAEGRGEP